MIISNTWYNKINTRKDKVMMKIFLSIMMAITFVGAVEMGKSGGSCVLAQEGEFKLGYNEIALKEVEYIAKVPSGSNFREIFVGSKAIIANENPKKVIKAEIIDYKPNKRIKGKPKTGIFIVEISRDSSKITLPMQYSFDAGVMKANATIDFPFVQDKESLKIWFETDVKYSLCSSK